MEMKSYQRRAVDDLSRYMELLNEAQDYARSEERRVGKECT